MHIRDFTSADYPAVVNCQNTLYRDFPAVVEDYVEMDETRDPKCNARRWIAAIDGVPVAYGEYSQSPWNYHPQHFTVVIRVLPDYQRRGIGGALYDTIRATLQPFDPLVLRAVARDDQPHAMAWLEKRGFVEDLRDQRSALDVATFDPAPFTGTEERLAAKGVTIKTYNDLVDDPDRDHKLYRLEMDTSRDVPGSEDFTEPGFDYYQKATLQAEMQPKAAFFVAVTADGEYVGLSTLWADRASDMLYTSYTGVRREFRRKSIATALKLHAIQYAQQRGNSRINTDNAATNPMLQLNYQLGFRPTPAWIIYKLTLQDELQEQATA